MSNNNISIRTKIGRILACDGQISENKKACNICGQKFHYINFCDSLVLIENNNGEFFDHAIHCNLEAVKERKRLRNLRKRQRKKLKKYNKKNNEVKNDNTPVSTIKKLFVPQEHGDKVSQHTETSN